MLQSTDVDWSKIWEVYKNISVVFVNILLKENSIYTGGIFGRMKEWMVREKFDIRYYNSDVVYGLIVGKKVYIGSATNFALRFREHINCVRRADNEESRFNRITLYKKLAKAGLHKIIPIIITANQPCTQRVEKAIIKSWQPKLNMMWTTHKQKRARDKQYRRPPARLREKTEKPPSPLPFSTNVTSYISTGYKLHSDLFRLLREHTRKEECVCTFHKGTIDASSYKRISKVYAQTNFTISADGIDRVVAAKALKATLQTLDRGTISAKLVTSGLSDRETRHKLLQYVHSFAKTRADLWILTMEELWNLWSARIYLGSKKVKHQAKWRLDYIFKQRLGTYIPSTICIRIPYSAGVDKYSLLHTAKQLIKGDKIPNHAKAEIRSRIKVVFTRHKRVGELICNFKTILRNFTLEPFECTCQKTQANCMGPDGHFAKRMSYLVKEGKVNEILGENLKNVTAPDRTNDFYKVYSELARVNGIVAKLGGDKAENDKLKELAYAICGNKYHHIQHGEVTERAIINEKKTLKGKVIMPLDKNTGEAFVACPTWYYYQVRTLYSWEGEGANYKLCNENDKTILELWTTAYKKYGWNRIAIYNKKGTIPTAVGYPKDKDPARMRPIVSYFSHPLKKVVNPAARAILHLLKLTDSKYHFTLWTTQELVTRVIEIQNEAITGDAEYEVNMRVEDIKNMFTSLKHDRILVALQWLLDLSHRMVNKNWKNKKSVYITIPRKGRGGATLGRAGNLRTHTQMTLNDIKDIVTLELESCYFKLGTVLLQQEIGIPMGSSASPPLAILTCAFGEYMWSSSVRTKRIFYGLRYVDDRITIDIRKKGQPSNTHLLEGASKCYDSRLKLELVEEGSKVHMLESVISFNTTTKKFEFGYWNKNWEVFLEKHKQKIRRWIDYWSFGPRMEKTRMVMGILAKLERLCITNKDLILSTIQLSLELRNKRYPWGVIVEAVKHRMSKNTPVWTDVLKALRIAIRMAARERL